MEKKTLKDHLNEIQNDTSDHKRESVVYAMKFSASKGKSYCYIKDYDNDIIEYLKNQQCTVEETVNLDISLLYVTWK